jgi:transketolase
MSAEVVSSHLPKSVQNLEEIARSIRHHILNMTSNANSGHPGGSLSSVEILTALYFGNILRYDPRKIQWPDRDRFILSKGHACPVLYGALAEAGYFPIEELMTFRKIDSRLQGHANTKTPGVEMSSGSLGMGLSFGLGVALSGRLSKQPYRVYTLLGDGECDEGQIWEAAMSATHYKADNLTAIVDRNRIQNDRSTDEVMQLEPFIQKWQAFGWYTQEVDGHDLGAIIAALNKTKEIKGIPSVIVANTIKGKGVSFMEGNPSFHGKAANKEELIAALKEIG